MSFKINIWTLVIEQYYHFVQNIISVLFELQMWKSLSKHRSRIAPRLLLDRNMYIEMIYV